jgi:ATP-dependent RNA helicase RhlE
MKFNNYNIAPAIRRSLAESGLIRPTDIQFKAIPPILKGEDVLAISQTGTGKTAAFVIPVLNILQSRKVVIREKTIRCLVLEPTRELALQISEVFKDIGKYTGQKSYAVFGGVEQDSQISQLVSGIDILVATPGRMFDLISQGYVKLDQLEILILDEADQMLDLGFIRDIRDLMKFLPAKRQTLFFSATINAEIKKLAYSLVRNPIRIQISPKDPVSKNVDHYVSYIAMEDKRFFLERIIRENPESKVLVFVRTKVRAERVNKALERVGIKSETIHGDKDQKSRLGVMKQFKEGSLKTLIATDVSARGIDIPDVEFVVNYDLPELAENYIHRVGRTGRGTKKGQAVSFCSEEETPLLEAISTLVGKEINVLEISHTDYKDTIDFSEDTSDDWQSLLKEEEKHSKSKQKRTEKE